MIQLHDVYDLNGHPRKGVVEFFWALLKTRQPEMNISHQAMPTEQEHFQFVWRKPYRYWYLIEYIAPTDPPRPHDATSAMSPDREWVGYVSATYNNQIGIVLLPQWRGKGLGSMAVRKFVGNHRPLPATKALRAGEWLANINPDNEASRAMFQEVGFRKVQETYSLPKEEQHGIETSEGR